MPKKKIQEGTAEIDADVIVVKPEKQSDYAQFAAYAQCGRGDAAMLW